MYGIVPTFDVARCTLLVTSYFGLRIPSVFQRIRSKKRLVFDGTKLSCYDILFTVIFGVWLMPKSVGKEIKVWRWFDGLKVSFIMEIYVRILP